MKFSKLIFSILSLIIISCSSDLNEPSENKSEGLDYLKMAKLSISSITLNGVLSAMYYEHTNFDFYDYYRKGAVFETTDPFQKVSGGTATISDNTVQPDIDYEYHNKDIIQFGQNAVYGITGNLPMGISPFTTTMYVPEQIHVVIPNGVDQISKAQGITITWNTDNNNAEGVYVGLNYLIIESNEIDPNMPDEPIIDYVNVVDNGSYTISPATLTQFPTGAMIELVVARGNYKIETVGSRNYLILGHVSSISEFEVLD